MSTARAPRFDIVVPTSGRPSLERLLQSLEGSGARPGRVLVVRDHDRAGPAAARNRGWRAATSEWVVFLDDDVVLPPEWGAALVRDLAGVPDDAAGVQGHIRVPLPDDRPPTDWERNVAGLERACWASADIAYRRSALARAGGFDERFPRAYREDADLALRMMGMGLRMSAGSRHVIHPVGDAGTWVSVRKQAGNMDDALMRRLHGRGWRERADVPRGRRPAHVAITLSGAIAVGAALLRRPALAAPAAAGWLAGTAELAVRRIAPGPRTAREVATMALTSAAVPAAATAWWLAGLARWSGTRRARPPGRPAAVLLDRDGTLVVDVPYNGDPSCVMPMPGAREAVERLRAAGVPLAVVSNQSGVGRGLLSDAQVHAVNRRIEELLGPLDYWALCPHRPDEGCDCRKPQGGLLQRAARELGVRPERCAVVGDIGSDMEAALAVGARGVLVPTDETRAEEITAAPEVAPDLSAAVSLLIGEA